MCSILGIEQFVFHLNCEMLTVENKKRLEDVINYAADLNIMMMYESDSHFIAHDTYDVLDLLDLSKVIKIIIEVRNINMVKNSFRYLDHYLMDRFMLNTPLKMVSG